MSDKKYLVAVTDSMGSVVTFGPYTTKAYATKKGNKLAQDGAYSNPQVVLSRLELVPKPKPEPKPEPKAKAKTKAKAKAKKTERMADAPSAKPRSTKPVETDRRKAMSAVVRRVATKQQTVDDAYVKFVRMYAPKVLGVPRKEFHAVFGTGHVNQGDVVWLSLQDQWDDSEAETLLAEAKAQRSPKGVRGVLEAHLDAHGVESTRRGTRTVGRMKKAN